MLVENIHAPQGRVPVAASSLTLPSSSSSRPDSRPDFARGFGLEVPEEEEEMEEFVVIPTDASQEVNGIASIDDGRAEQAEEQDGMTTVAQSTLHSRQVSNAMSVGSAQGISNITAVEWLKARSPIGNPDIDELDQDAMGEWTGSEDLQPGDMSEDEVSTLLCGMRHELIRYFSGQIHQTRRELVKLELSCDAPNATERVPEEYLIFLVLQRTQLSAVFWERMTLYPTQVRKVTCTQTEIAHFWALGLVNTTTCRLR